ncbi:MAG: ABC transporter substrate-binding protein [Candidatus Paceibacterota bacterium]|jgi:peptide/nickel transport system substrate-binding protein
MDQFNTTGKLPTKEKINRAFAAFSKKERVIFGIFCLALLLSSLAILQTVNKTLMVAVPFEGGTISEGIVGTPRFINPVLASSPADLDMSALIYSGLMRKSGSENPIPDLAEKYEVSDDALTYTFTLRDDIYFHNEEPVTADDVIFTIDRVKNSVIPSPQKVNWEGVSVRKVNNTTIEFNLRQPNANFLENATLGILPKALWENDSMELNTFNTSPVGSGPYKIESVAKEESGIINSYQLVAFEKFALGEPYIKEINFHFYQNEDDLVKAFEDGTVGQVSSLTPAVASDLEEKNYQVTRALLPRVFGLFFNQNQNQLFLDKSVTRAIHDAIDKDRIVRDVLKGYGVVIDSPIPPNIAMYGETAENKSSREEVLATVRENLDKAGWTLGEDGLRHKTITENKKKRTATLEFSIFTSNAPELAATAELIKEDLSLVGMKVDIKTFEKGNLNQNVIIPRKYDALLFGQVINRESDLFAFWHSSQRKDLGSNVAIYTNPQVDSLLEDAPITINPESRAKKYAQIESAIKKDIPAVFLYSPDFIYVVSGSLKGLDMSKLRSPEDRFGNVYLWFTKTENVWKIFAKN